MRHLKFLLLLFCVPASAAPKFLIVDDSMPENRGGYSNASAFQASSAALSSFDPSTLLGTNTFPREWSGSSGGLVAAGVTIYIAPNGFTNSGVGDIQGRTRVPLTRTTTLQNLVVFTSAPVGSGKTDTVTVFSNGVSTGLTVSINGTTQTNGFDITHAPVVTVSLATTNLVGLGVQIVTAASSTPVAFSWAFEGR